ncbi:SMP-30/gluconolactonase/LRE family protein [Gluconacetobacter takamatsuzukensis]|uniref:Bleomycin resistance protein n=1 Tax=Gluconacetobacter takamatsuzukensis TaxID=1286190 RepID=A0A7W4KBL6_9PROT|nr:L-dopachrome tautomerase-related protein [Gluconacetobacter takamatsuzukensis]MBB2203957.1 bleomycin resistance protein [Gluconacetobacter takamatsuzukensis]
MSHLVDAFNRPLSRRAALTGLAGGLALAGCEAAGLRQAMAAFRPPHLRATVIASSPRYLCNAVAATRDGTLFLGAPRWELMEDTPSVFRVAPDGGLHPFPGGSWNQWKPGGDPTNAFLMVNGLHIFSDDTLWVVDQGVDPTTGSTVPGGQKLVQFDTRSGKVLQVLRWGADILPPGSAMNDLRIAGDLMFVTDSGLGGIIIHHMGSGETVRRLSEHPLLRATDAKPMRARDGHIFTDRNGKRPLVHSDMLEITADRKWFYFSAPVGPLRRLPTSALLDMSLTDAQLAAQIETVLDMPTMMGTAIDTLDNVYFADAEHGRITVLTPERKQLTLFEDPRLVDGDALFITADRHMLVPIAQTERLPGNNAGINALKPPFISLGFALPETLDGHRLGNVVSSL